MLKDIKPSSFPKILTAAMVSIVLVVTISLSGFFVFKSYLSNSGSLDRLQEAITAQQYMSLRSEVATAMQYLDQMRSRADDTLRQGSKEHVDQAYNTAMALYLQEKDKRSEESLRLLIKETLRGTRFFDQRGYIFILSGQGVMELAPFTPEREGVDYSDVTDDTGAQIIHKILAAVNNSQQAGFATYRWYPENHSEMAEKASYVRRFEPYGWVIGGGDYLYEIENTLKHEALKRLAQQRFGQNGYFAVINSNGDTLINPSAPNLNGMSFDQMPANAQRVVSGILKVAEQGGGFSEYSWRLRDTNKVTRKISLIQPVDDWDWVLIAGIYPEDISHVLTSQTQALNQSVADNSWFLLIAAVAGGAVTFGVAAFFSNLCRRLFREYQAQIDEKQGELVVASRVFDAANEGIMVTDHNNKVVAVNQAFERITGYSSDEVEGADPNFLSSGSHPEFFYRQMWQQLQEFGYWQGEICNRRRDGRPFPEWLSISVSRDEQGNVQNYIATLSDISERKRNEERLRYLSEYDTLTDLPNRTLLADRTSDALLHGQRYGGRIALIHLDIDRFKNVNTSLSNGVGDRVLQELGRRLMTVARPSDTLARLGGDSFAILMTELVSPDEVAAVVRLSMEEISKPLQLEGQTVVLTSSAGIALSPDDGCDFDTLLRNSDTALHHVKASGRDDYKFYTQQMNEQVFERLTLEAGLRSAITEQQFELFYQPQFCLDTEQMVGCEALIRWKHPTLGMVSPIDFIPLAEETGLIQPIGEWVLQQACKQAVRWDEGILAGQSMAVNVSAYQIKQDLEAVVKSTLLSTGLDPNRLILEVTETALMEDMGRSIEVLEKIRKFGVKIALDDFGTGYSSLSYLKRFSLDKLKIDRAFVMGLPHDRDDCALTCSIIDIAKNMQLDIVAEGIEDEAQKEFLLSQGCKVGQGYWYAKPLAAKELEQVIREKAARCIN